MGRTHLNADIASANQDGRILILQRLFESLDSLDQQLKRLEESLAAISRTVSCPTPEKEWYTTTELANLLGKSDFTVREKWCNHGRIACEKAPDSNKWRIPAAEVRRLQSGGTPRAKDA